MIDAAPAATSTWPDPPSDLPPARPAKVAQKPDGKPKHHMRQVKRTSKPVNRERLAYKSLRGE